MRKAGYICREGQKVLDSEGFPREILILHIHGARLAICLDDLVSALRQGSAARVERIKQNWMPYLAGLAGLARVSRSGKALNIDLVNGDRFTLPLDSLMGVLDRSERFARIAELPPLARTESVRNRLITEYCQAASQLCVRTAADVMTA